MNRKSNGTMNPVGISLLFALLASVWVTAGASSAMAFPGGPHGGCHRGGDVRLEQMADQLGLNDEQRQQIKMIHRAARNEGMQLRDSMHDNMESLHKLDPGMNGYDRQVVKLADKQGELMRRMIIHHEGVKSKVFALLTPDQRSKAASLVREHKHRGPGEHHRRAGGSGDGMNSGAF